MHSNSHSASSPGPNTPIIKKAKVEDTEQSDISDTICPVTAVDHHHSSTCDKLMMPADHQRINHHSSIESVAGSSSKSSPVRVSNLFKRSAQHSDNSILGGRHSTSAASSLKHNHSHMCSNHSSRSQREQNVQTFGAQASYNNKHGDSESPALSINGHSSYRFSLDSSGSSRRSSASQSPYGHSSPNNDEISKQYEAYSTPNDTNKSSEISNIGRAGLRKSSLPSTSGRHTSKPPGTELGRGEGTVHRAVREHEQRAWRNEVGAGVAPTQQVGEQLHSAATMLPVKKSPPTYRTVLAKRGLVVRDTLGSGSYSKVKLAVYIRPEDQDTQVYPNQVAVKIIDRKSAPRDFQEKFLPRELEMWPHLSHPNIVQMLHYFTEGYRVYMILEFIEGGDALRYIQNKGAVSESTAKSWVHQVADAVKYLHELQITHRDLKLENMLIDRHNNIKICDFGFVKQCTDNELSKTFCGSKSYAAPEILKGEPYPPKKADVWAIGVILFILVTGRMPFDETKGNSSLLDEHRRLDLQWPRGRRAVTSHCKALSVFCLKFLWADRPTIQEVLSHPWFKEERAARHK